MDRIRPSAFFHSRHSYLCAVANLANVGGHNRCGMSMEYAEIQQSGRGKFEKVGEKGVRASNLSMRYFIPINRLFFPGYLWWLSNESGLG